LPLVDDPVRSDKLSAMIFKESLSGWASRAGV